MKRKVTKKKEIEEFIVPLNAQRYNIVSYRGIQYGWCLPQYRPGIITLLNSNGGDLKKAKKQDMMGYFKHLLITPPKATKRKPIWITEVK